MGYATISPYTFNSTYLTATAFTTDAILGTVAADRTICSIKTMDYSSVLQYAFAEITIESARDTSGALNYTDATAGGYLLLDDGSSTKNAGYVYSKHFMTAANGLSGACVLPLRVNLNTYLQPDTEYTCTIKNAQAIGNNLYIYQPIVNIKLYGNV